MNQKSTTPKRIKREVLVLACVLYPLYIGLIAYAIISAYQAGASGFWKLFWMGYTEMFFVNLGKFFGLDWPLLICPLVGFICAGIGMLLR